MLDEWRIFGGMVVGNESFEHFHSSHRRTKALEDQARQQRALLEDTVGPCSGLMDEPIMVWIANGSTDKRMIGRGTEFRDDPELPLYHRVMHLRSKFYRELQTDETIINLTDEVFASWCRIGRSDEEIINIYRLNRFIREW
jgi:hypothetical protein